MAEDRENGRSPGDRNVIRASLVEPPVQREPGRGVPPSGSARGVRLILILLVLGPVLWMWAPRERARWYTAKALEQQLAGDPEEALTYLNRALEWDRQSDWLYRQRADWLVDAGRYEQALEDYTRAIALSPGEALNYMQRSVAWQYLGRHDQSIADWERVVELFSNHSSRHRAIAWNGLAYARALGKRDLEQALEDIERALAIFGPDPAMLDTRGYLRFLGGDLEAAREDLNQAVQTIENQHAELKQRRDYADRREHEQRVRQHAHSVAVLRYHRALIYEQLGEPEQAAQDVGRVRQLGFEPDRSRLF